MLVGATAAVAETENNNTRETANPITVGVAGAQNSAIMPAADVDWYRFEAQANVTYAVEVLNVDPNLSASLFVYNQSGSLLEGLQGWGPNGSGNVYQRASVRVTVAQTIYVAVRPYHAEHSGSYTVRVLPDYSNGLVHDASGEPNDTMSLSQEVTVGLPMSWTIQALDPRYRTGSADQDWFRWTAQAGKTYTITAAAPGFRTDLYVYDSAGTRVTYDTYCEAGKGCSLTISPTITQVYSAMATAYNDDASGAYAICVSGAGQTCRTFWDVPAGTQFYNEISWLAFRGITTGYQDGSYKPVQPINRDAMAAFLYRLAGSPAFTPTKQTFVDVPRGAQFYKEIEWLATKGITSGWDTPRGKEYRPVSPIGRDAMAAFLYRLKGQPAFTPSKQTFTDVTRTTQFYKEIEWMASTKITTGYPDNTYRPTAQVGRDAMAAFLYRYVQLFGDPGAR